MIILGFYHNVDTLRFRSYIAKYGRMSTFLVVSLSSSPEKFFLSLSVVIFATPRTFILHPSTPSYRRPLQFKSAFVRKILCQSFHVIVNVSMSFQHVSANLWSILGLLFCKSSLPLHCDLPPEFFVSICFPSFVLFAHASLLFFVFALI